jgi:uncharacterized membrane protein
MTGTLLHLVLAALAFVGGHFLLSAPGPRAALVARLGERGFAGAYSVLMIAALIWLGLAFGAAPFVPLWTPPGWARWIPVVVMPLAALLVVCGYSQYNPTVVAQRIDPAKADPAPGILKVTRHPIMWGIGLWALAHIPPNGDLAALILFGALAVLALYGTVRLEAKRRARDPGGFARFAAVTSNIPFRAIAQGRARLRLADIGLARLGAALVLYLALAFAHPWIAGVAIH